MKKLNFDQMVDFEGGNYCANLTMILQNNCIQGSLIWSAYQGWQSGGCGSAASFSGYWQQGYRTC